MVQVLSELNPRRTFGSEFGKSLGQGVSQGLGFGARLGLKDQEQQKRKMLEELLSENKSEDPQMKFRKKLESPVNENEEEPIDNEESIEDEVDPNYLREATKKQVSADFAYKDKLNQMIRGYQTNERIVNRVQKILNQGYKGKPYEKILDDLGLSAWTSKERREMASLQKELVAPTLKKTLGGNFSASEFNAIMGASFSPDYSQEANQAILDNIKLSEQLVKKEIDISNKLMKGSKRKPVIDLESKVLRELQESTPDIQDQLKRNTMKIINAQNNVPQGKTLMYDPKGNAIFVPDNPKAIQYARSLGASSPQDAE